MAKVLNAPSIGVTPSEVKDGEVCEIIRAQGYELAIGTVLQCIGNAKFIVIGESSFRGYSHMGTSTSGSILVRILPKGTTIEL